MTILRIAIIGALLAALAACSTFPGVGSFNAELSATESMTTTGTAFDKALHREYGEVARIYYNNSEMAGVQSFNRRAAAAGNGEKVEPWHPDRVPNATGNTEVHEAYDRLGAALDGGGAESAPDDMARAQAAYDCWLYSLDPIPAIEAACKERFAAAMAALAPPLPPAPDFVVLFDFDSAALRPNGAEILNKVLAVTSKQPETKVVATGHADLSGAAAYNLGLSERRSILVRDYLINGGLAAARVSSDWRGETDPRVATPDGTKEQQNRRVDIMLK